MEEDIIFLSSDMVLLDGLVTADALPRPRCCENFHQSEEVTASTVLSKVLRKLHTHTNRFQCALLVCVLERPQNAVVSTHIAVEKCSYRLQNSHLGAKQHFTT
jgi:hypothetical protein